MTTPDVSRWKPLGPTHNADMYEVEPGILAVVPHEGCVDTAETASENFAFQQRHWEEAGRSGGVLIFMDLIRDQHAGARRVYSAPSRGLITGFALIGGTVFGRAVASVFLGLSRPAAPTKMFGDLEAALAWLRELNQRGRG